MRATSGLRALTALAAIAALGGCETQQQIVSQKEDLLAAAGFEAHPATTPERQQMLQKLPPNRFVMQDHNGHTVYIYADPIACNCVYFGDAAAYSKYKQERFQQQLADEQQTTAQLYTQPGFGWGAWGPWGPGWAPGFWR